MGICEVRDLEPGVTLALALQGSFALEDAQAVKDAMADALTRCALEIRVSFTGFEGGGVVFYQLLFAMAKQAALEGKTIRLPDPLPAQLLHHAGRIGIVRKDFESLFA